MVKAKQTLIAFWRYDKFPFVLGGEVTSFEKGGHVEVKGYGGCAFMPFKIVRAEEGREILAALEELERGHDAAQAALRREWLAKRKAVIEVPGEKP